MEGIMTVTDLMEALGDCPPDAAVMIAVVKYPEEFPVMGWLNNSATECLPLEPGEITVHDGIVHLAVELTDYDALRHFAGG